jgi:hypothetical protein
MDDIAHMQAEMQASNDSQTSTMHDIFGHFGIRDDIAHLWVGWTPTSSLYLARGCAPSFGWVFFDRFSPRANILYCLQLCSTATCGQP